MGMSYWPITLYGVDIYEFKLKHKYTDNECDDIISFLEYIEDNPETSHLLSHCTWTSAGSYDEHIYVGYLADYPWDMDATAKKITKQDVIKEIQDFLNECFMDVPEDYVEKNIGYIAEVGCD